MIIGDKKIRKLAKEYLNQNPGIRKSLKLFNISTKTYTDALNALRPTKSFVNTRATAE